MREDMKEGISLALIGNSYLWRVMHGHINNLKTAKFAKERNTVRNMAVTAVLSSIATILMFFEFALPIFPSFVKIDLSDLPALIGAFTLGPINGIMIEAAKNVMHLILTGSSTGGIGEMANFIVGTALVFPAGCIYKYNKTKKYAVMGMVAGTICMAVVGALANYFILIPFYQNFMPLQTIIEMCAVIIPAADSLEKVVLYSIIPFNIFKGLLVSLVTFFTYKRLTPILKD